VVRLEEAVVPDDVDVVVEDCELVQPATATTPQMRKITTMNVLALIPEDGGLHYLFIAIFLHGWTGHNQRRPHQNQNQNTRKKMRESPLQDFTEFTAGQPYFLYLLDL